MESSAIHQTTTIRADYNTKQGKTPDNLTPKQRAALKSLMKKRSQLRFLPGDKGNATVILNDQQYIEEHVESSGCYNTLNKDPTTPRQTLQNPPQIQKRRQYKFRIYDKHETTTSLIASTLWTAQDSQTRSPHPSCCFLLKHTLFNPPQSSTPQPQTLSKQLHPPQRHQ